MANTAFIWIAAALYIGQAGVNAWHGQWPYVVIFISYAIANIGIVWSLKA